MQLESTLHHPQPSLPQDHGTQSTQGNTQRVGDFAWQRFEGSGAMSRRCRVCLSTLYPPGLCALSSGPREAADATGSASQKHLALKAMPATAKLEGVLQPWTSMINKYVVGDVLKELKSDPSTAQAFFHWAQTQPGHIGATVHAYSIVIVIHGRARDLARVEALLEEMKSQNIQPGIVTFNQLLDAYGRAAKWAEVDGIRSRMAAQGLSMDIFTCQSFVASGGKPNIKLYSRLIWLYGQCGDTWKAQNEKVLRQMNAAGGGMELLGHHTHGGLKLLLQNERGPPMHSGQHVRANVDALVDSIWMAALESRKDFANALVGFLWDAGQTEQAFMLWDSGKKKGLCPSTTKALQGKSLVDKVELITGLGNRSMVKGMSPVKYAITQMVSALGLPFDECSKNPGCLKAKGEHLRQWLLRPEAEEELSFRHAEALQICEPHLAGAE
eukprot:jgi/Mesen1/468/ME000101S10703